MGEKPDFNFIQDIDKIIHSPARLLIMSVLHITEEVDFYFLLNRTELTKGNLSSHMAKLEKEGYVIIDKKFINKIPKTTYKLSSIGKRKFEDYIGSISKLVTKFEEE